MADEQPPPTPKPEPPAEPGQQPKPPEAGGSEKKRKRPILKHRLSLGGGRRVLLRNIVVVEEPPNPPEPPDPAAKAAEDYEKKRDKYEQKQAAFFESATAERNRLIGTKTDQSKSYDQTILTFSAGAIALSITFVEKIAPTPAVPVLLYVAWSFFGLAVLFVVLSFLASQAAFQREIDVVNEKWAAAVAAETQAAPEGTEAPKQVAPPKNRLTNLTRYLNYASGGMFVSGIIFFVLFGIFNWPVKKEASKIKGAPIKIEITGEVMPGQTNVVTTSGASIEIQKGATPTPAMLAPVPQPPPPAPAPAPQTTTQTTTK